MKQKRIRKLVTAGMYLIIIITMFIPTITANIVNDTNVFEKETKGSDDINIINNLIVDVNGGGNYTKIQDAINNATDGDFIQVWDGVYKENIIINKTLNVFGNSSKTTTIEGFGVNNSAVTIAANEAIFSGFTVQGGDFIGIELVVSQGVKISENNINNNTYGIWVFISSNNIIQNNNFMNNLEEAVSISLGLKNQVINNNFINNTGEKGQAFFWNSLFNKWQENYWDDYSGSGAKKIQGQFDILSISIPWANYDRNPQTEPYDIE